MNIFLITLLSILIIKMFSKDGRNNPEYRIKYINYNDGCSLYKIERLTELPFSYEYIDTGVYFNNEKEAKDYIKSITFTEHTL